MPATTTALTTIELLEKILLYLSIVDLTLAKRVSPLWQSCIQGSTLLQRRLFQEAIPASEAPAIRKYRHYRAQPVSVNPLLRNVFRIRHSEISGSSIALVPATGKTRLLQRELSESVLKKDSEGHTIHGLISRPIILESHAFYQRDTARRRHASWSSLPRVRSTNFEHFDPRNSVPVYAVESWASMLVTQPPIRKLNLHCDYMENGAGGIKVEATDGKGITLGDMAKAVAEFNRLWGQQLPELSIYQPLDVERSNDGTLVYFADGMRRSAESYEEIGFQRAWKTKFRCNLG
jgi:hypothetical protein